VVELRSLRRLVQSAAFLLTIATTAEVETLAFAAMSAYSGLTRQPSTGSSSSFATPMLRPSHLRTTSNAGHRMSWRQSGAWDNSAEMIEAKAHPGGVLKGL